MVTQRRWSKAQAYEKAHWQSIADKIVSGAMDQLDWYAWKAGEFEKRIAKYSDFSHKPNCKILEIGSGPIGIVAFLKWGQRYAIDPLEDFYSNNKALVQLRNRSVTYLHGQGEKLPFEDKELSIVIIDNVIDHTQSPKRILEEINRVLKDNGVMFLTVNIHTKWGTLIHSLMEFFQIDKGHPHTFSCKSIRGFLNNNGFAILSEELEDYNQIRRRNCQSKSLKDKIKGYSGISEIIYTCICQKCYRRD
jgi:ubiquinone/menaquinone biosynthesis C-methylase UbiE